MKDPPVRLLLLQDLLHRFIENRMEADLLSLDPLLSRPGLHRQSVRIHIGGQNCLGLLGAAAGYVHPVDHRIGEINAAVCLGRIDVKSRSADYKHCGEAGQSRNPGFLFPRFLFFSPVLHSFFPLKASQSREISDSPKI